MAAPADARLQDLQRMNAAAKESVNIFDKLFARARLSEKDQAKLQNGQRQLYQELADQERKLSPNSPAPKPVASPAPSVSRPSISDFGSPMAVPSAVSSLRKEQAVAKAAPRTPTMDMNGRAPAVPKGTPKAAALKPAASAARRASEVRREGDRFGASSPVPQTSRAARERERDRDRDVPHSIAAAPATPKKPREAEHTTAPTTPSSRLPASHTLPTTPSSKAAAAPNTPSRLSLAAPGTPSARLSLAPAPTTPSTRLSLAAAPATPSASRTDLGGAQNQRTEDRAAQQTLPVVRAASADAPQSVAAPREDSAAAESRAFNSATITQLEAENKRLQRALRGVELEYERLRVRHQELLTHSLDLEEQLVNSEADKVSIIATCMRILKEAGVQHDQPLSQQSDAPIAPAAPADAHVQAPPTPHKQVSGADDSGWLEDGDVQESLKELGADVTVPERTQ